MYPPWIRLQAKKLVMFHSFNSSVFWNPPNLREGDDVQTSVIRKRFICFVPLSHRSFASVVSHVHNLSNRILTQPLTYGIQSNPDAIAVVGGTASVKVRVGLKRLDRTTRREDVAF